MATAFPLYAQSRSDWRSVDAHRSDTDLVARLDIMLPRETAFVDASCKRPGQRVLSQNRRRAVILAAARSLFAEGGPRNVTIRNLATRSGVTAPTIYKLIGGRGTVVEQALMEGLCTCIEQAPFVAERCEVNLISGFIDTLWRSAAQHPSYSRHQIDLSCRSAGGRRIGSFLREGAISKLSDWIDALCDPKPLSNVGGASAVANALEAHLRIAFIDWADGASNLARLRRNLASGTTIILTGLVDELEQYRLQQWLTSLNAARIVR